SIVSFVVRLADGRYLHHNAVVAILNDLFGIQSRGGCSCAGPYGHHLLGIDDVTSAQYETEILRGCEGIKPGWVRVNFNYFLDDDVFEYIVNAVVLVAEYGERLLPQYHFDPLTGLWRHRNGPIEPPLRFSGISYDGEGRLRYPTTDDVAPAGARRAALAAARALLEALPAASFDGADLTERLGADAERLRRSRLPVESLLPN